jgi:hypothetical protein
LRDFYETIPVRCHFGADFDVELEDKRSVKLVVRSG